MRVVKVTKAIGGTYYNLLKITLAYNVSTVVVIASNEPIIIGKAPPTNSSFPNMRHMFINGTFDYKGPAHLQPSSATTRKKKPKVPSSHTQTDGDTNIAAMDSTTAIHCNTKLHLKAVIPPSHPFKLAKHPPTKPVVIEVDKPVVIEVWSSPDGIDEPHDGDDDDDEEKEEKKKPLNGSGRKIPSKDDKNYDDFSHSWKQKLKAGSGA